MVQHLDTIIVGGGQAGLATSYYLAQRGCEHLVLEQAAAAGNAWRNDRWDSFTLLTPNWANRMPGVEHWGDTRDGFLTRAEIVAHFEHYAQHFGLPLQYNTHVTAVESGDSGYSVRTDQGDYTAANVVIATGLFQKPKIPDFAARLPKHITQLHSGAYRNPQSLPPGAVLIVGAAQSGCQIAEELHQSGRAVHLCVSKALRAPRRYRGRDIFEWLNLAGFFSRTVDKLPAPQAKFAASPQLSGTRGGHSLNLHQFARDGISLLGHLRGVQNDTARISLAPDLHNNLAVTDQGEANLVRIVDDYIARNQIDAPKEDLPQLRDGFAVQELTELDLDAAGISSIIWASGYSFDYSLIKLPVTADDGFPMTQRGVTRFPGLYFIGMPWLHTWKSGLLLGVGEDAAYVAEHLCARAT